MSTLAEIRSTLEKRFVLDKSYSKIKPWIVNDTHSDPAEDPVIYSFKKRKEAITFRDEMIEERVKIELSWESSPAYFSSIQGTNAKGEPEYTLTLTNLIGEQFTIAREVSSAAECDEIAKHDAISNGTLFFRINNERWQNTNGKEAICVNKDVANLCHCFSSQIIRHIPSGKFVKFTACRFAIGEDAKPLLVDGIQEASLYRDIVASQFYGLSRQVGYESLNVDIVRNVVTLST